MTWILKIHSKWCFFQSAQVPWTYFDIETDTVEKLVALIIIM